MAKESTEAKASTGANVSTEAKGQLRPESTEAKCQLRPRVC